MTMAAVWISKRDAIALVAAAQGPDTVSRSGARSTLALWVRRGLVRTKATADRPPGCKHFRKLYRRADVARRIAARTGSARKWQPHEDALVGALSDREVARRLRRTVGAVAERRRARERSALGGALGPRAWRRAPDDPRLEPPELPTG